MSEWYKQLARQAEPILQSTAAGQKEVKKSAADSKATGLFKQLESSLKATAQAEAQKQRKAENLYKAALGVAAGLTAEECQALGQLAHQILAPKEAQREGLEKSLNSAQKNAHSSDIVDPLKQDLAKAKAEERAIRDIGEAFQQIAREKATIHGLEEGGLDVEQRVHHFFALPTHLQTHEVAQKAFQEVQEDQLAIVNYLRANPHLAKERAVRLKQQLSKAEALLALLSFKIVQAELKELKPADSAFARRQQEVEAQRKSLPKAAAAVFRSGAEFATLQRWYLEELNSTEFMHLVQAGQLEMNQLVPPAITAPLPAPAEYAHLKQNIQVTHQKIVQYYAWLNAFCVKNPLSKNGSPEVQQAHAQLAKADLWLKLLEFRKAVLEVHEKLATEGLEVRATERALKNMAAQKKALLEALHRLQANQLIAQDDALKVRFAPRIAQEVAIVPSADYEVVFEDGEPDKHVGMPLNNYLTDLQKNGNVKRKYTEVYFRTPNFEIVGSNIDPATKQISSHTYYLYARSVKGKEVISAIQELSVNPQKLDPAKQSRDWWEKAIQLWQELWREQGRRA